MQHLDVQIAEQALTWLNEGETIWFCTVLSTFGSSPREPGSTMVAKADGKHLGSLSGGCVEDDFLERLQQGEFAQRVRQERYGEGDQSDRPQIQLPCGGLLDVLIEQLAPVPDNIQHMQQLLDTLKGQRQMIRSVSLSDGSLTLDHTDIQSGQRIKTIGDRITIRVGPAQRLIIAGLSTVSRFCAEYAVSLGYDVIVCEPREEEFQDFFCAGAKLEKTMPSSFIRREGNVHAQTAIVAMTHDPRIDDLAMIEAVKTPAFYIGVMGSRKTSDKRAERLMRSGGLNAEQIERIHMPIGLSLGSKTPAEIALAVMADVLRCMRGIERHDL
ncbi:MULTISPECIES: XdhC family protein [unclassified Thalassolituus]|uniref:XdhC family protein n=1 Tax=unclassified Thalassolituus TaxID=2624967 RepID=UPI000C383C01|nr:MULTISPECIES: XdhC family protein [unclassified Thalassolituus]MBL36355.1 XshC-Cox1 family protein [Oceanospirillaceae bacterium]|tara:strand:- start:1562 stop:2542 length:981 start_codon:yes stop_codon:yes gene_type:complete